MARLKTDAERGRLGAWAYNTRDALDLSVEAVIDALPTTYHPATLRKVEGGTVPPGRRMWREIGTLYGKVADEKRVAIDPQPRLASDQQDGDPAPDLAAALMALTAELAAVRQERSAWERGVLAVIRSYRGAPVPAELLDALAPLPLEPARPGPPGPY